MHAEMTHAWVNCGETADSKGVIGIAATLCHQSCTEIAEEPKSDPFVLTKTDQHQEHDLPEGKRYGQQCRNPQLKWTLRDQLRVITGDTHGCKWSATPPQSRRTQLDTGFDERRDGPPVSVRQDPSLTLPQTQVHPRHR
jgi:hypothetical protein